MAFAVSNITQTTVFGNMRVVFLNVTPDSAEGTVTTGLNRVFSHQVSLIGGTASLTCMTVKENLGTTGTVAAGVLGLSNVVNGGLYRFTIYGD